MKIPKQAYTTEFKELAVKRMKDGQSISKVCKELGLSDQTIRNWVKATSDGKLSQAFPVCFGYGGASLDPVADLYIRQLSHVASSVATQYDYAPSYAHSKRQSETAGS